MKKKTTTVLAALGAVALALATASPAMAQSANFGGKDCAWPNHAGLHLDSKGTQYIKVVSSNSIVKDASWSNSSTTRLNRVNSDSEDASSGRVETSASYWLSAGWDA